jgi:DNA mismatch endonuclease (patch repair protein)
MRRVRSRGTRPEMIVRGIVRRMGIRYHSCPHNLPGKPVLVTVGQRKAILVHVFFWGMAARVRFTFETWN